MASGLAKYLGSLASLGCWVKGSLVYRPLRYDYIQFLEPFSLFPITKLLFLHSLISPHSQLHVKEAETGMSFFETDIHLSVMDNYLTDFIFLQFFRSFWFLERNLGNFFLF